MAWVARWTEDLTLIIDGVSVPIDGSMQSPFLTVATHQLEVPSDSVVANVVNGDPSMSPSVAFTHAEWIAIIKPLPVGEHIIEIRGGNTGLADPQGSTENIWYNWVVWHITVTP